MPERHALVLATAHAHGIFLRLAQAGNGLAGIEHGAAFFGHAGNRIHIAAREGRRTTEQLQEVERRALGCEDGARLAADVADIGIGSHQFAFLVMPFQLQVGIDTAHAALEPGTAAQHGLLAHQHAGRHRIGNRHQLAGPVADADIFRQGVADVAVTGLFQGFVEFKHGGLQQNREINRETGNCALRRGGRATSKPVKPARASQAQQTPVARQWLSIRQRQCRASCPPGVRHP